MSEVLERLMNEFDASTILTKEEEKGKYLTDWPQNITGRAAAIARPRNTQEVAKIIKIANKTSTPVVPQGGNTGTAGGSIPDKSGNSIVLSLERMNKIREISLSAMTTTVEAGCILQNLHNKLESENLLFPLNFGAKGSCMIGGNLATNAGGQNVVRYGNTRELCLGIEAVTANGSVLNLLSGLRKDNTGYDLRNLLIGSEGTLGIITAATLKLFNLPKARATAFISVPDINRALTLLNLAQEETGGLVEAFELMPKVFLQLVKKHAPQHTIPFSNIPDLSVLVEIATTSDKDSSENDDGVTPLSRSLERILELGLENQLLNDAVIASSESQRQKMWHMREGALEVITAEGPRIGFDISLPLDRIHEFVEKMCLSTETICPDLRMCHMGHLGDGNLHYSIFPPEGAPNALEGKEAEIKKVVYDSIGNFGGSFSAEHGIGISKLSAMSTYKDPASLISMKLIKKCLDPKNILNPGKLLPS